MKRIKRSLIERITDKLLFIGLLAIGLSTMVLASNMRRYDLANRFPAVENGLTLRMVEVNVEDGLVKLIDDTTRLDNPNAGYLK